MFQSVLSFLILSVLYLKDMLIFCYSVVERIKKKRFPRILLVHNLTLYTANCRNKKAQLCSTLYLSTFYATLQTLAWVNFEFNDNWYTWFWHIKCWYWSSAKSSTHSYRTFAGVHWQSHSIELEYSQLKLQLYSFHLFFNAS